MTRLSNFSRTFVAAAALAVASPFAVPGVALAQAGISAGMQIVDPAGNPVGTVSSVSGDNLIVKTDRHEVQLPANSFTPHEGKLLFAMTRDSLNATVDQELAAAEASLVAGAEVRGSDDVVVGQIDTLDAETVTIKLTDGALIRLPRSGVGAGQNGPVLGVTAEELRQLAAQSAGDATAQTGQ